MGITEILRIVRKFLEVEKYPVGKQFQKFGVISLNWMEFNHDFVSYFGRHASDQDLPMDAFCGQK